MLPLLVLATLDTGPEGSWAYVTYATFHLGPGRVGQMYNGGYFVYTTATERGWRGSRGCRQHRRKIPRFGLRHLSRRDW